jgi:hypothetical protein
MMTLLAIGLLFWLIPALMILRWANMHQPIGTKTVVTGWFGGVGFTLVLVALYFMLA